MGYTIRIGNAVPYASEDCEDSFGWRVETVTNEDAPEFGDTAYQNERLPSYSVWAEFGRETVLTDVFESLMPQHPGIAQLKQWHLDRVQAAISQRKESVKQEPGFWDLDPETRELVDNGKDPQLARLVWVEFWMSWALANSQHPALQNS